MKIPQILVFVGIFVGMWLPNPNSNCLWTLFENYSFPFFAVFNFPFFICGKVEISCIFCGFVGFWNFQFVEKHPQTSLTRFQTQKWHPQTKRFYSQQRKEQVLPCLAQDSNLDCRLGLGMTGFVGFSYKSNTQSITRSRQRIKIYSLINRFNRF